MKEFEIIQECLNRVQEKIVAELNAKTIDAITDTLARAGVSNFLASITGSPEQHIKN